MRTGVAVIGIGMWGVRMGEAARRAGLDVVTCFARDARRRAAAAERLNCESAPSLEAAIEHPRVGGVLVVTPNEAHADQAIAAAERGRHVFVEKPIADTVAQAERIRDTCAAAGVQLMVGHAFRRLGAARRAKELVDAGRLGTVVLAEATFSLPGSLPGHAWRAHRETNPGGPLMQLGIHHVDTLACWLGPIARSTGRFARVVTPADIDDVGVICLEFASGALGVISGSYVSPKTFAIRLQGTDAILDLRTDLSIWPDAQRMDAATTLTLSGEAVGFEERDMLAEELAEFGRCIREGVAPETGAEEGIAALRAISDALALPLRGREAHVIASFDAEVAAP